MQQAISQPRSARSRTAIIHEFNAELVEFLNRFRAVEELDDQRPLHARSLVSYVSWSAYQAFLRAIWRKGLRHTYREGTLEIMAPRTYWRESRKSMVRRFVQHLSSELAVNLTSLGRAPLVSRSRRIGLEPDEAFAVAAGSRTRFKPNLAIEVEDERFKSNTISLDEHVVSRMRLLREIGIAEVWFVRDWTVTIFSNARNRWQRCDTSQFFPGVSPAILSKNLDRSRHYSANDVIRRLVYDCGRCKPPKPAN